MEFPTAKIISQVFKCLGCAMPILKGIHHLKPITVLVPKPFANLRTLSKKNLSWGYEIVLNVCLHIAQLPCKISAILSPINDQSLYPKTICAP
jgi:hypothetical protein